MSYHYLASPYSKYRDGIEEAYREVCRQVAVLLRAGIPVLSPIAATHGVAIHGGIDPLAHDIWLPADRPLMEAACGLIVCKLNGWDRSFGVAHEIEVFRKASKPIVYMEPGVVPVELVAW